MRRDHAAELCGSITQLPGLRGRETCGVELMGLWGVSIPKCVLVQQVPHVLVEETNNGIKVSELKFISHEL